MYALMNGSSTKEFMVDKGLRQGDPISSFLFVLAAEGLTGLVRKVKELDDFSYFNIIDSCEIYILQFADYTLMVGNGG